VQRTPGRASISRLVMLETFISSPAGRAPVEWNPDKAISARPPTCQGPDPRIPETDCGSSSKWSRNDAVCARGGLPRLSSWANTCRVPAWSSPARTRTLLRLAGCGRFLNGLQGPPARDFPFLPTVRNPPQEDSAREGGRTERLVLGRSEGLSGIDKHSGRAEGLAMLANVIVDRALVLGGERAFENDETLGSVPPAGGDTATAQV
jgi:hypothetical protein